MMDKDELQMAICYSDIRNEQCSFLDGIDWFKSNVWHDAKKDRPKHKAICLCWDKFMVQYRVLMYDDEAKYWCDAIFDIGEHVSDYADYRITRWLYIDDLIK